MIESSKIKNFLGEILIFEGFFGLILHNLIKIFESIIGYANYLVKHIWVTPPIFIMMLI